jgi:uncharacterized protein YkwD
MKKINFVIFAVIILIVSGCNAKRQSNYSQTAAVPQTTQSTNQQIDSQQTSPNQPRQPRKRKHPPTINQATIPSNVDITVFGTQECGNTQSARDYLSQQNINFRFVDINTPNGLQELDSAWILPKQKNSFGMPVMKVCNRWTEGWDVNRFKRVSANCNKQQSGSGRQGGFNQNPVQQPPISQPSGGANCNYSASGLDKQVFDELNLARTQPAQYANIIAQYSNSAAAQEAVAELRNTRPLSALSFSSCLARAAQDHVKDTGSKGIIGHNGSDGSNPGSRIARYSQSGNSGYAENVSYGMNTGKDVMLQLIIDDGVPSRGHRRNIFNSSSKSVGISCGAHAQYRVMCVQDFSFQPTP